MKLRFSIRDLLPLTLVVALVVGWSLDRSHYASFKVTERDDLLFLHERSTGNKWYKIPGFEPWYPANDRR